MSDPIQPIPNLKHDDPDKGTYTIMNTSPENMHEIALLENLIVANHQLSRHKSKYAFQNLFYLNEWTQFNSRARALKVFDSVKAEFNQKRATFLAGLEKDIEDKESERKKTMTRWSVANTWLASSVFIILVNIIYSIPWYAMLFIIIMGIRAIINRLQINRYLQVLDTEIDHLNHDKCILNEMDSRFQDSIIDDKKRPPRSASLCYEKLKRYIDGSGTPSDFIDQLCDIRDDMTDLVYGVKSDALSTYLIQLSNLRKDLESSFKGLPQKRSIGKLIWYFGLFGFLISLVAAIATLLIIKTPLYAIFMGIASLIMLIIAFRLSEKGDRQVYESESHIQLITHSVQTITEFIEYGEQIQLKI